MIPTSDYLLLSMVLFTIGVIGVVTRRNVIIILMSVELMLNAVNINLVAFWRFWTPVQDSTSGLKVGMAGQAFAAFVFVVAAAEVAVGLALILSMYRNRRTVVAEDVDTLRY
jgi:NADH-quinone oxidoreductase subunit K